MAKRKPLASGLASWFRVGDFTEEQGWRRENLRRADAGRRICVKRESAPGVGVFLWSINGVRGVKSCDTMISQGCAWAIVLRSFGAEEQCNGHFAEEIVV